MNDNKPVTTKKELPTIQDLHFDKVEAFKKDKLNQLLNNPPPVQWLRKHPMHKKLEYIPISMIEMSLTMIFQEWKVEVIDYKQMFQSVSCHIRLHYLNPITNKWMFHDGLGAVAVQTNKGSDASDLGAIKSDAVMKALPAAKSYALKDAADHLGKLFGRDLNRDETIGFFSKYEEPMIDPQSGTIGYIEGLIRTSNLSEDQKLAIESELESPLTQERSDEIIESLKMDQAEPIESGDNFNQSDINRKLDKVEQDDRA